MSHQRTPEEAPCTHGIKLNKFESCEAAPSSGGNCEQIRATGDIQFTPFKPVTSV